MLADLRDRLDRLDRGDRDGPPPVDPNRSAPPAPKPETEPTPSKARDSPSLIPSPGDLLPTLIAWALPALGIPAGAAAALWAGYRAIQWWRRRQRTQDLQQTPPPATTPDKPPPITPPQPAPEVAGVVDFPRNPARDDTEAKRFLRLAELEGRDPVHDALIGRFALDELGYMIETEADQADWAQRLQTTLEARFNRMVPLKRTATVKE